MKSKKKRPPAAAVGDSRNGPIRLATLVFAISALLISQGRVWAQQQGIVQKPLVLRAASEQATAREPSMTTEGPEPDAEALERVAEEIVEQAEANGVKISEGQRTRLSRAIGVATRVFLRVGGWSKYLTNSLLFSSPEGERAADILAVVKYGILLPASIVSGTVGLFVSFDLVTSVPAVAAVVSLGETYVKHKKVRFAAGMDPADLLREILEGLDLNKVELIQLTDADGIMNPSSLIIPVSEEENVKGAVSVAELESVLHAAAVDQLKGMGLSSSSYKMALVRDVMTAEADGAKALAGKLVKLNLDDSVKSNDRLRFFMQAENLIRRARLEREFHAPKARLNPCEWTLRGGLAWLWGLFKVKGDIAMEAFEIRLLQQRVCGNAVGNGTSRFRRGLE